MGDDEAEGSKVLVLKLYGEELGPQLAYAAGYGRGYNYRKVLEPTEATTQCENTGHKYEAGMKCYMCGVAIPSKADMKAKMASDELWPECEHILPLTEGRWLLDIYMTNRIQTDQWSKTARELEYDQAHRVCNQAKKIDSYITRETDGTATVSKAKIREVLDKVVARATKDIDKGDTRKTMKDIAEMDVKARTAALAAQVQRLVDHINNAPFKQKGEQGIVVLMQTALFVDPDSLVGPAKLVHDAWYAKAGDKQATFQAKLKEFIRETNAAYPLLADPEERDRYFKRLLAHSPEEQAFVASVVSPLDDTIERIFKAKTDTDTPVDPRGEHFLRLVTYGIFDKLLTQLRTAASAASLRLRCDIFQRMTAIASLPGPLDARGRETPAPRPRVAEVFGPPPTLSPKEAAECKTVASAATRAAAAERRETEPDRTNEDIVNEIVERLRTDFLPATFQEFGINPSTQGLEEVLPLVQKSMMVWLKDHPDDIKGAQRVAARGVSENAKLMALFVRKGVDSAKFQKALEGRMPYGHGAGRHRKTYRKTSKRRKTLRKRIRARVVPK